MRFGQMQAVADEDQRCGNRFGLDRTRAENGIAAEFERLGAAIDQQSHGRFGGNHSSDVELDGLIVAVYARRLQSRGVELRNHVFGGAQIAFRAGEAALHAVVGKSFNLRPPCFARGLVRRCDGAPLRPKTGAGNGGKDDKDTGSADAIHHLLLERLEFLQG